MATHTHTFPGVNLALSSILADGTWDAFDPFGSAMEAAWALCEVSRAAGLPTPSEVGYRSYDTTTLEDMRSVLDMEDTEGTDLADVSYSTAMLASDYLDGLVTDHHIWLALLSLHRYIDLLRAEGLDY